MDLHPTSTAIEGSVAPVSDVQEALAAPDRISRRQFVLRNLALAGTVVAVQGNEETEAIEITQHRVAMPHLQSPTRVVQLTDLHRSWCVSEKFIARIVAEANALKPDLFLVTGDFVTRSSRYIETCAPHLAALRAPLGVYGVLGNHDYWCDGNTGAPAVAAALNGVGVRLLINQSEKLANGIRLVGVDDCRAGVPDPVAAFARTEAGEPILAMTHNPDLFPVLSLYDCLTLAGHTHGGQIAIPYVTLGMMERHCRFMRGWFHEPGYPGRLYVSRGLGTIHIPMRIGARPEIAVFDLIPA